MAIKTNKFIQTFYSIVYYIIKAVKLLHVNVGGLLCYRVYNVMAV